MAPRTQQGSKELGNAMRKRREELGLTVEQAASRARIGSKTWSRYESGASIRSDKVRGVCAALGWKSLEQSTVYSLIDLDAEQSVDIDEQHAAWSRFLERIYGRAVAVRFCVGSDILFDDIQMDLTSLSTMPRGSHLGELDISMIRDYLPRQFLTRYDYDFLFALACRLRLLRMQLHERDNYCAQMVADELLLHLIDMEAVAFMGSENELNHVYFGGYWATGSRKDGDLSSSLYAPWVFLEKNHAYHFDHWFEPYTGKTDSQYAPYLSFDNYGVREPIF